MKILFYTQHLYYLPQFLPVARAARESAEVTFILLDKMPPGGYWTS